MNARNIAIYIVIGIICAILGVMRQGSKRIDWDVSNEARWRGWRRK